MRRRCLPALIALALCGEINTPHASQTARTEMPRALLGVPIDDEYREADKALANQLSAALGIELKHDDKFNTYSDLIERVTTTRDQYLARMTPYAFVAAEMLGAPLEVLATYESLKTGSTTYQSYFVVNAKKFQEFPATLDGVYDYLRKRPKPARFVYHDKFSTSSYLLPALWFRSHRIFATEQPASSVLRVDAAQDTSSSTESVDKVAADQADLAAVWDGTKLKYSENPAVLFIPLSLTLPNDLLVSPASLGEETKTSIRKAIETGPEIGIGDFKRWRNIDNAALNALNSLRRVARAAPAPVVVRVSSDTADQDREVTLRLLTLVEEVKQAVRLAGTELVPEDKFHEAVDVIWTVKWVHDGAILLVCEMQVTKEDLKERLRQEFHISFTPTEGDLTKRIVSLIHSRMHRIRYIWPYQDSAPTVIRDVDFTIPKGEKVYVQRLTWRDPDRNLFVPAGAFDTVLAEIGPAKFVLDKRDFIRTDTGTVDFQNPLSDVAYKVILERRSSESAMSKVLASALIGLFLLTGTAAAFDMRRRLLPKKPQPPRTLPDLCAMLAAQIHGTCERPLTEAGVILCNRERVEEHIEELKSKGLVPASMGGITRWAYGFTAGTSLPFVKGVFSGEASRHVELVLDPTKIGNTLRLNALVDLMIRKQLLSSFVGRPLEWEALNELARAILPGAEAGDLLIRPEDETVIKIASSHFRQVLDDGMKRLSLLPGSWSLSRRGGRCVAQQRIRLRGPILVGEARVSSVLMEFNIADEVELPLDATSSTLDCWVLGKIVRPTIVDDAGTATLCLDLRVVALLLRQGAGLQLVTRPAGDVGGSAQPRV